MDPHRFDRLSKAFASRLTRRKMIGGLGAGGLAAAALGEMPSLAANDISTCVYDFDGVISIGPSSTLGATNTVAGELTFTVGADGAIDSGKLVRAGGDSWTVVGQAVGRAINRALFGAEDRSLYRGRHGPERYRRLHRRHEWSRQRPLAWRRRQLDRDAQIEWNRHDADGDGGRRSDYGRDRGVSRGAAHGNVRARAHGRRDRATGMRHRMRRRHLGTGPE